MRKAKPTLEIIRPVDWIIMRWMGWATEEPAIAYPFLKDRQLTLQYLRGLYGREVVSQAFKALAEEYHWYEDPNPSEYDLAPLVDKHNKL
jgi:hypothetical protein